MVAYGINKKENKSLKEKEILFNYLIASSLGMRY